VSLIDRLRTIWQEDGIFRRIVLNSSYLFSSSAIGAGLGLINSVLLTRLLGLEGYGLVNGTIILFASNINNLLAFRMYEAVVKFVGDALQHEDNIRAAALVKGIGLAEAGTSILAYLVLLTITPWAARTLGKDIATAPLFTFYGLVLLVNLVYETSRGVLQMTRRFDRLSQLGIIQSVLTTALIGLAFVCGRTDLWIVLGAYLVGKTFGGVSHGIFAFRELNQILVKGWWRISLRKIGGWKEVAKFAVNTNLNATVNLFVRDSIPNLLVALRPVGTAHLEVGYFRLAQSIISLVLLPIGPFIWPTYTEITRTVTAKKWATTRNLLKRISVLAATWTISTGIGLAAFGWALLPLLYGDRARPAYLAVLVMLVGYGVANIFNWNRPLLLALSKPFYPLIISALVGLVELIAVFVFVPTGGYMAMAVILSAYFTISVGIIVWRGLKEIHVQENLA